MKLEIASIYNSDTRMYDVCVVPFGKSIVLEFISSCKTFENADWIVNLINKECGNNEK